MTAGGVTPLPARNSVEQCDDRTVGDPAPQVDGLVLEQGPKRGNWRPVLAPEIPGNARLGTRQGVEEFLQRAGLCREDEVEDRPAQDHTRRACEGHLNAHDATAHGAARGGGSAPWALLHRG